MSFLPQTDPLYLHYAQQRDREDVQLRQREEQERTLIAEESSKLVQAAFNGDLTTFGELLEQIIEEYHENPAKFLADYKPALMVSLDNTINSHPRADKRLLKEILTLMLDKDNASEADKRIFEDINLGKALTDAVAQKKWWAVHTLLLINPHKYFFNMPKLDDLLKKVILEEHENQTDTQIEQTEQLDEATAAAGAAAANPLQTQSLEKPGDSEQEAAVDPQENSVYLILIIDLLLEYYHANPCQMITISNQHEEHEATKSQNMSLMHYYFKVDPKKCHEFFVKCALSEYGLENNIGFNLLSFNIETAFANESPDLSFISRQLKPELTNLYGDFEQLHQLIQVSLKLALNHEKISEDEKLDLILDFLKLSIKELKEPSELHLENLRLCVEHALDHKKIDLLLTLLNSGDIYNCEDEAQEASAASASSDKKDIRSDMARIICRDIVTAPNFKDKAELLNELREFDFCKFEYTKPSYGHTLLSLALFVNNQTAFNILANDQKLLNKTLDNILNFQLIITQQDKSKLAKWLSDKIKRRDFDQGTQAKIMKYIGENSLQKKQALNRSLSSSSLMQSESDSGAEDEVSGGAAAATKTRVTFAGILPAMLTSQKAKPSPQEPPSGQKIGARLSMFKLTEEQQGQKDSAQLGLSYDDL